MFREYREIVVGDGRVNFNVNYQENIVRLVIWARKGPEGEWELAGERSYRCFHLTKLLRQITDLIAIDEEPHANNS